MPKPDPKCRRFLEVTEKYRRSRMWTHISGELPFQVIVDGDPNRYAVTVLGQAGIQPGISVVVGDSSYDCTLEVADGDSEALRAIPFWHLSWDKYGDIDSRFTSWLGRAGWKGTAKQQAPFVIACDPYSQPRVLRGPELHGFTQVLELTLECHRRGQLEPVGAPRNRRRALLLEGDEKGKLREVRQVAVDESESKPKPIELNPLLKELPSNGSTLSLATSPMGRIEGKEEQASVVVLYDGKSGLIAGHEVVLGDPIAALGGLVEKTLSGKSESSGFRGRPEVIRFESRRLFEAVRETLERIGVAPELNPDHSAFHEIDTIFEAFVRGWGSEDDDEIPESCETLEEWQHADALVTQDYRTWMFEELGEEYLSTFFGVDSLGEALGDESLADIAMATYLDWLYLDHSAEEGVETDLESIGPDEVDSPEHVIMNALRDSWVSLFRVKESGDETLRVADLRDRKEYTVHDVGLSRVLTPGACLFLRLHSLEAWTFARLAGPLVPQHLIFEMLDQLENAPRSKPHTEHFRDRMTTVGRFWLDVAEAEGASPQLVTSDGDTLEPLKATFSVAKVDRLLKSLAKRKDLEPTSDHEWVWLDEAKTVLGSLELFGDELLLEVFSRGRLDRARAWLEDLPGVEFVRETPVDLSTTAASRGVVPPPMEELPPEALAEIAPMLETQIRSWLDQEVPALDGKTPRDAVKDPELRERAAKILRGMDDPMRMMPGPPLIDFEAIRRAMLEELGLE